MTTAVYRLPERKRAEGNSTRNCLVAHLRSTSPEEAIERLKKAGVLAIPGPTDNSIVLVGYHVEVRALLDFWRTASTVEQPHGDATRFHLGKLRKLASNA